MAKTILVLNLRTAQAQKEVGDANFDATRNLFDKKILPLARHLSPREAQLHKAETDPQRRFDSGSDQAHEQRPAGFAVHDFRPRLLPRAGHEQDAGPAILANCVLRELGSLPGDVKEEIDGPVAK